MALFVAQMFVCQVTEKLMLLIMMEMMMISYFHKYKVDCRRVYNKGVLMIMQSGNGCGSTVPMQKVSPKMGLPEETCYGTKVLRHKSATAAKWCHQHDAL